MTPATPPDRGTRGRTSLLANRNGRKTAKQRNRGGNGNCAVCNHDLQAQIEGELLSGVAYRVLAKRYGMSIAALSRHRTLHVAESAATVHAALPERGDRSFLDRLDELIAHGQAQLAIAEKSRKPSLALLAIRELGRLTELRGKATGELDERPTTVVNLQTTQEWIQIRTIVLEVLGPHPELRQQVASRLQLIEGAA